SSARAATATASATARVAARAAAASRSLMPRSCRRNRHAWCTSSRRMWNFEHPPARPALAVRLPDQARHVRKPGRAGREGDVLERDRLAVPAFGGDPPPSAVVANDARDHVLALDCALADRRPEQLLERAAEQRAGTRVRRDVVPVVVPDEEADLGSVDRLGEEGRLHLLR